MTVIIDASAMAELLDASPLGKAVIEALGEDSDWAAPEHFRVEVVSALRGRLLGGYLSFAVFRDRLEWLAKAEVDVFPTAPLLPRIAELASNANPYDAAYLALAEQLEAAVVTTDAKMRGVPGARCAVRVLTA